MATLTAGVTTPSTTNASSYVSDSFTPAAGDLLVVATYSSGVTGATPTLTASANGITFTKVTTGDRAGLDDMQLWVANQLVPGSPSAMTLTYGPGGSATGAIIACGRAAGITKTGLTAIRQHGATHGSTGSSISVTLSVGAALTTNPCIEFYGNAANPAGISPPSGWTERDDTGFTTPSRGLEWATIDSGFTGSSIAWTGVSGTWVVVAAEIDASVAPGQGSGTGSWSFSGAGAGTRTPKGSGTGSWSFAGAGSGTRTPKGSGSGSWAFSGEGVGATQPKGAGAGSWSFAGSATGERHPVGTGAGSWSFSGEAAGSRSPVGSGAGAWSFSGSAAGVRNPVGIGAGTWGFTGAGSGGPPAPYTPAQVERLATVGAEQRVHTVRGEQRHHAVAAEQRITPATAQ